MAGSGPSRILPDSATFDGDYLSIGGCPIATLAETYGTPLYVYDEATLRNSASRICAAFAPINPRVSYAAKACATIGVLRVLERAGLGLDVVSAGELDAGLRAGFDPDRIHLHGNFKTHAELHLAIRHNIHAVVVDNLDELIELQATCRMVGRRSRVMLRIALNLSAETHPHLRTSGSSSKFGIFQGSADLDAALGRICRDDTLHLIGIHTHLGSQITDPEIYRRAAEALVAAAGLFRQNCPGLQEVSVGGGWAVAYRPEDTTLDPETVATAVAPAFRAEPAIRLAVEPGRALVARAAVSLYRVGPVKKVVKKRIIAVDGGMGDNLRPALYGAEYTALVDGRAFSNPIGVADIVGRYCEAGDVLVREALLPEVSRGDLLCVPVSGAYQVSMVSVYNLVPPPAVVMVANGKATLLTRRATVDDLLAREQNSDSPSVTSSHV
jgi:diaminopimelate decarboxylase